MEKLAPATGRYYLPLAAITIAEALRDRGYRTASIGKWHLGTGPDLAPERQGFDVAIGSGNGAGHTRSHVSPYRMSGLEDGPAGELLSDRLSAEAVRFIDANHGRPFFLLLSHYAVHEPLQAKPGAEARYLERVGGDPERARYAAMIEATDRGLGRVLDALDRHGIAGDTVVILTSDNGGNRAWASLGRLRGTKNTLYEGGLRVPLIVRWPRAAPAGRVLDAPVMGIDLYPTLLEIAHAAGAEGQALDGVSLVPLLRNGGRLPPRPLFWHFPDYLWSERLERFRLKPSSAVLLGDHKLLERFETGGVELYDLAHDPSERDDVSAARPEKVRELRELLAAWRATTGAALPRPR
jgi:arylsulfatase A-like enzyme